MKTYITRLWYSRNNVNLINLIFTWDCFLMYLLKIHVDLCQLNQCILDWNLKNNNTKTQYKVVYHKSLSLLYIMSILSKMRCPWRKKKWRSRKKKFMIKADDHYIYDMGWYNFMNIHILKLNVRLNLCGSLMILMYSYSNVS